MSHNISDLIISKESKNNHSKEEINYIWSGPKIKDSGADYKPGKFPKLDEAIRNAKRGKR